MKTSLVMQRRIIVIASLFFILMSVSCSRKSHPSKTSAVVSVKSPDPAVPKKTITKSNERVVLPKVISVNDSAAHKSVDGRLYYDVMGHRYWKNNQDGKYYIFNQSMYDNPAFKGPQ